ncbi:MAG: hypothetical protein KAX49_15300 [Halanaerobiales bacterium]|nr:hypothetical protein [Halanaerobiales bacterium]
MTKQNKKRLGRVYVNLGYTVDLDNDNMIDEAIECIHEDINNSLKHAELDAYIKIDLDPSAKEEDIPEFLLEIENEDNE